MSNDDGLDELRNLSADLRAQGHPSATYFADRLDTSIAKIETRVFPQFGATSGDTDLVVDVLPGSIEEQLRMEGGAATDAETTR